MSEGVDVVLTRDITQACDFTHELMYISFFFLSRPDASCVHSGFRNGGV